MCLCIELSQILNIGGLLLDCAGVVILFLYTVDRHQNLNKNGDGYKLLSGPGCPEDIVKWKRYNGYSVIGLVLIVTGFLLQASSNFF